MSSKAYADRLAKSLESTGLVQAVNSSHGESQVKVLCRVLEGCESGWVKLVRLVLMATQAEAEKPHGWQTHICRLYFLKEVKNELKLVFGWNVSIQARDMGVSLDFLGRVIRGEPVDVRFKKRPGEVEEIEFTGMTGDRKPSPGGKGAYPIGSTKGGDFRPPARNSGVAR